MFRLHLLNEIWVDESNWRDRSAKEENSMHPGRSAERDASIECGVVKKLNEERGRTNEEGMK